MKYPNKKQADRAADRPATVPVSQPKRWLFRLTFLLLPFLLLGALEVCLRLAGYGYNPDFFKRLQIGGEDFYVQNEDFNLRFFPREIARYANPVRFPAHKAPGTFRIFVLGESAAMGDPAPSFAGSRYLEMLLREKYPDRKFEVINVAFTAINSHVILPIARECAEHEGDLWIIYMGNNEMVGPFGAATVFSRQAPPLSYVRLVLALQRLRLGQWFTELSRKLTAHGRQQPIAWGGMEMFLHNQIPPGSPLKETVYRNFQKNLDDMIRAGVGSGAKVLLNIMAVNLNDCPPFASLNDSQLSPADRAQFDSLYTNGLQAAAQPDFAAAGAFFAQAAQLDERPADLQFHWAECCRAQTNLAAAREHFQLACDNDALPFRADSRINAAIRSEREKAGGDRLLLCDAPAVLTAGPDGLCGSETFFEHVHFDFDARYRLARAWAEQIEPLLTRNANAWISQADCEHLLGLSPWNRAQVIHFMVERMEMPPLNDQANNQSRRDALVSRINQLGPQMNAENVARTRANFSSLQAQRPEDFYLHQEFGVFLEVTGDLAGSAAQWQCVRDLLPQDSLGYYQYGRLLNALQRYPEAEASLRMALAMRPTRTDGWIELGNCLALQQKYAAALDCYVTALKQDPQNPQTLLRRGKVLDHLNRPEEAVDSYRAAIQLNPTAGVLHNQLALGLMATRQPDSAGLEFNQAAQLSPKSVEIRFNYGVWLLQQKRWDEAQREFAAVIRLDHNNLRAQKNLAWLRGRGNPPP